MDKNAKIGTIGDVNFIEYGGGIVYDRGGEQGFEVEWVEPTEEEDFETSKVQVYRVSLSPGGEDWWDNEALASFAGVSLEEFQSVDMDNPIAWALNYALAANYYGWSEMDMYPLELSREEAEKRYEETEEV